MNNRTFAVVHFILSLVGAAIIAGIVYYLFTHVSTTLGGIGTSVTA